MKIKKRQVITILIILGVIIISLIIITRPKAQIAEDLAKCIGENSELYVKLGCRACESQEKMFGEYYQYLDITDCWFEGEKCSDIQYTPTWIIKGKVYVGVQSLERLKELTEC